MMSSTPLALLDTLHGSLDAAGSEVVAADFHYQGVDANHFWVAFGRALLGIEHGHFFRDDINSDHYSLLGQQHGI